MADSVSKTNIPVLRSPYGSEVPPKVPVCETDDVGSKVNPVYVKDKVVKASDANVGDVQQPVYMKNGNITAGDVLAPVKAPHIFRDPDGGSMTSDVPTSSTPQDNDPDTMIATKKYVDDKRTIVEVSPKTVEGDLICEITVDGTLYKIYNGGGKGNAFVVTFKDWDATTLKEEPVLKGGNATPPTTPTRTGYTFSSWSGNYTNVQKDETVTATYTINKYTVTFNLNGGNIGGDTSNVVISNVEHGTTIGSIRPTDPTRTQTAQYTYTFNGWNKADTTAVTGNTTVTAQWTETTRYYDIIWKNNGGSQLRKDNLAYGSTPSYGSTPEAENKETGKVYTFTGWSPEVSTVTGSATYTAQYSTSATTFSVYFNPNGGKINNSTSTYEKTGVAYNTTLANVPPPTATRDSTSSASYTFKGWGESSSATTPVDASTKVLTGSKTFYALWTETPITAKYTVTFNPDGGKINGSTANVVKPGIESGTLVSAIPPPADSTMSRDKTAQYTYSFNGWSKTSGGTKITPGSTSVTSSFTLYALWNRTTNSYAIQFFNSTKANVETSRSLYGPNNVSYGSTPSYGGTATTSLQPTDAESGKTYTFTGWKRTSDSGIGIKSVTGAENYYAQYSSETTTYTVKYYPNNGTLDGSTSVQTKSDVAHGSGVYETGNFTKARTGYTFGGWATSSTGSAIDESSVIPTAGKDFYAVWNINSWTVTVNRVNTSGGTAPTSTATKVSGAGTYNYGAAVTTSGSVESGYTNNWVFKGMECASGGVTTPTSFNMPNNNVVINAKFAPKFLVRFYYKTNGSAIKIDSGDQYVEYKTAATAPTKPTVTGWTAGNWDKTFTSITAATDVTCQYTINSHTLTITRRNTVSGGTAPTATETTITGDGKKNYGTVVTPTASVNSSYTNNWVFKNFKDSSGSVITSVTMPDSDVTIYADFTPKYAVSFYKIVDGVKTQVGTTQYVEHGGNATAPTKPTVDGHTAGDWKGTYTNVTSNQEVTCTYTINTHTVTFSYYNGTSAKTDVRTVDWGTTYSGISKPTDTTRTGYNFTGWGDPTPSSAINSSGQVIGNCVVNGSYEILGVFVTSPSSAISAGEALWSTDGINWTSGTGTGTFENTTTKASCAAGDSTSAIVGLVQSKYAGGTSVSSDGKEWSKSADSTSTSARPNCTLAGGICASIPTLLRVNSNGGSLFARIPGDTSWTKRGAVTSPTEGIGVTYRQLAYGNGVIVVPRYCGNFYTQGHKIPVYLSTDGGVSFTGATGSTYYHETTSNLKDSSGKYYPMNPLGACQYVNGKFIQILCRGYKDDNNTLYAGAFAISTNGTTWPSEANIIKVKTLGSGLTYIDALSRISSSGDGYILIVRYRGTNTTGYNTSKLRIFKSSDLSTWTQKTITDVSGNTVDDIVFCGTVTADSEDEVNSATSIAYGNGKYVIACPGSSNSYVSSLKHGVVISEDNGETWTFYPDTSKNYADHGTITFLEHPITS